MSRERIPMIRNNKEAYTNQGASVQNAKECLADPKFDKYKRSCETDLRALFQRIIEHKDPDPVKYAFFIQAKIKEYICLSILLSRIESDAGVSNES